MRNPFDKTFPRKKATEPLWPRRKKRCPFSISRFLPDFHRFLRRKPKLAQIRDSRICPGQVGCNIILLVKIGGGGGVAKIMRCVKSSWKNTVSLWGPPRHRRSKLASVTGWDHPKRSIWRWVGQHWRVGVGRWQHWLPCNNDCSDIRLSWKVRIRDYIQG